MKQYDYSFEEYKAAQIAANRRKEHVVWVRKRNIEFLCDYIGHADVIVCHGTRNGKELQYFASRFPRSRILGTEISPTGKRYPMTIEHDFHVPLGIISDVTYTNSLDHAFDPDRAVRTWTMESHKLLVEHSDCDFDDKVTEHDPFGASFEEIEALLNKYTTVVDILDMPEKHPGAREQKVFVCTSSPSV